MKQRLEDPQMQKEKSKFEKYIEDSKPELE